MPFMGLNGGPHFKFDEAVSFVVSTEDQAETDRYWNAIIDGGGSASECGWCKDKYGLSWQITPRRLTELFNEGGDTRQARFRGDDDDEQDRHRQARGRRRGRPRRCVRFAAASFVSLDGVMQAPGGPTEDPTGGFQHGGWLPQFFDEDVGDAIGAFFGDDYDLLLGRRTYDIFAAYWPYVGGEATGIGEVFDRTGADDGAAEAIAMGEAFTAANKYVLTRGSPDLGWSNSHRLGSIEELRAVSEGDGPDLLIQGSSTLYPQLLAEGLLDQLTVMTFPVVLGGASACSAMAPRPRRCAWSTTR